MRPCEDERLCLEAQVHYYDLLCPEETAVPASVRRHVAACPVCRENMRRLRESLMEAECPARPAGAWQDETVEALAQQFQLLDERVTCSQVKPRLPELALNSPQIRKLSRVPGQGAGAAAHASRDRGARRLRSRDCLPCGQGPRCGGRRVCVPRQRAGSARCVRRS